MNPDMSHLTADQILAMYEGDAHDCSLVMLPNPPFWNNKHKTDAEKDEIKLRAQTLQHGIRMSYDEKVAHTEKVIRIALGQDVFGNEVEAAPSAGVKWAVSYSGGKDSTVLSHMMVFGMGLKLPHVMSNTRMEYPETLKQVNKWYAMLREQGVECHTAWPDAKPKDLWKQIGVPLWSKQMGKKYMDFYRSESDHIPASVADNLRDDFRTLKAAGVKITDKCCSELKKKPLAKWDKEHAVTGHFTGIRCSESRARRLMWIQRGAVYNSASHRQWLANPLVFWTHDDVSRYLDDNDIRPIPIPTVRGGSGCVTCMFGCHLVEKGQPNTLQELKRLNPKMHKAALDDWGYREVLDLLEIPYE